MVSLTNPMRVAITGLSLILCMFATFYFLVILKTGVVYTHLFYLPIVLVGAWWYRKGVILTFSLVAFLLICNFYFVPDTSIADNLGRAAILLFVSVLASTIFEYRKRTEEKLKESEELHQTLIQASPDAIMVSDLNGNIIECNQASLDMEGFSSKDEVIGKNASEFIAKKDRERAMENLKKTLEQGSVKNVEYTFLTKDGCEYPAELSASVIKDSLGNLIGFVAITKDITERKKAEEEIKKFKTISDIASYGTAISDPEGNVLYVNEAFAQMHGYMPEELIGKNLSVFHTEEQIKDVMRLNEYLKKEGSYTAKEVWHKRKDGTVFPTLMSATFIKSEKGIPLFLSAIAIDITERKEAEEKLKQYTENLEEMVEERTRELKESQERLIRPERLAAVGEAAAMVGHDLRNPLQAIENAAHYLSNELPRIAPSIPVPQKAKEMFQVIKDSVDYADKIIIDLHDFSATKKSILKKTDINAIVRETLSQVEAPENVEIVTELGRLPRIEADKDRIKRCFVNLAINGIQAMENGGTLKVSTKKTKESVEVSFKDTGIGIPKDNIEKIFTPFFTTKAKGIGIGLAICKKFVDVHGGSIEVESEEGKGSTFTVKLPLNKRVEVKTREEE